jgi:hypothetical protein
MPRAKEGHDQRAQADKHPFEDDVRPFRGKLEQKREADGEIEEPPQHIDDRRGFPDPGGEANGVWNQAPLIP